MSQWYCRIDDHKSGPFSSDAMRKLAKDKKLRPTDLVRKGEDGKWVRASAVKGLFPPTADGSAVGFSTDSQPVVPSPTRPPIPVQPGQPESQSAPTEESRPRRRLSPKDMVGIGAIVVSVIVAVGAAFALLGGGSDDTADVAELPTTEAHPEPLDASKQTPEPAPTDTTAVETVGNDGIVEDPEPATTPADDPVLASTPSDGSMGETEKTANLAESQKSPSLPVVEIEQSEPAGNASLMESQPVPTQPAPVVPQVQESPTTDNVAVTDIGGARETVPATDVMPSPTTEPADFLGVRNQPGAKVARADMAFPKPANKAADAPPEIPQPARDDADIQPQVSPPRQPDPGIELRRKKVLGLYEQRKQLLAALLAAQAEIAAIKQKAFVTNSMLDKAKMNRLEVEQLGREAVSMRKRNTLQIQTLERQAAVLDQQIMTGETVLRALPNELRVATAKGVESGRKCDKLRAEWMTVHDPFGRLPQAEQRMTGGHCTGWLAEDPNFPSAYLMRGFAQLHLGELDKAQADFGKIIDQANVNQLTENEETVFATALLGRGWAHVKMNHEKEAMADVAAALDRRPKSALAYIVRGRAYAAFGRGRSALDDFIKATKLDKQEPAGYREAAWLLATSPTLGDGPRAVHFGRTACELTEWGQWRCLDTYAIACAAADGFDEAVKWATKAIETAPPEVQGELARRLKLYQSDVAPTELKRL